MVHKTPYLCFTLLAKICSHLRLKVYFFSLSGGNSEKNSFNQITGVCISDLHFASSLSITACGFILPVSLCLGARASSSLRCRAVLLYLNKSILLQLSFFPSIPRHYELFAVQSTLIFHSPGKAVDEQHRGIWGESGFKKGGTQRQPPPPPPRSRPIEPPALLHFLFSESGTSNRGEKCCLKNLPMIKKKRIKNKKKSARHKGPPSPAECENTPCGQTVFIFGALALSCQPKHELRRSSGWGQKWRACCVSLSRRLVKAIH